MTLLALLNELSYPCAARSKDEADSVAEALVETLRNLKAQGRNLALVTAEPLLAVQIVQGYPLGQWGREGRNRDRFRYLRTLQNRAPFTSVGRQYLDPQVEYEHEGRPAEGLGLAHALPALAVSLAYAGAWLAERVPVTRRSLEELEDGNAELVESVLDVRHASSPRHVAAHKAWLVSVESDGLVTGEQIWRERGSIFPNLQFLPRVEAQLIGLEPTLLQSVKRRLLELDDAARTWHPRLQAAPNWQSYVTGEAENRKRLCYFSDLDGEHRLFDLHARFTPTAGRIHFRLAPDRGMLVIAHVGRKLGT